MHHRDRPPSGLLPEIWIGPQLSRLILFHERGDVEEWNLNPAADLTAEPATADAIGYGQPVGSTWGRQYDVDGGRSAPPESNP